MGESHNLEAYTLEVLEPCMFAVGPSMELLVRFAVIDENIVAVIESDIPGGIAFGIPGEFVSVSVCTLVGRGDDPDVLSRIGFVPIELEEPELGVVIVSAKIVSYGLAIVVLIYIRSGSRGSRASREPYLVVVGARCSGGSGREIRTYRIECERNKRSRKGESKNTREKNPRRKPEDMFSE